MSRFKKAKLPTGTFHKFRASADPYLTKYQTKIRRKTAIKMFVFISFESIYSTNLFLSICVYVFKKLIIQEFSLVVCCVCRVSVLLHLFLCKCCRIDFTLFSSDFHLFEMFSYALSQLSCSSTMSTLIPCSVKKSWIYIILVHSRLVSPLFPQNIWNSWFSNSSGFNWIRIRYHESNYIYCKGWRGILKRHCTETRLPLSNTSFLLYIQFVRRPFHFHINWIFFLVIYSNYNNFS